MVFAYVCLYNLEKALSSLKVLEISLFIYKKYSLIIVHTVKK